VPRQPLADGTPGGIAEGVEGKSVSAH